MIRFALLLAVALSGCAGRGQPQAARPPVAPAPSAPSGPGFATAPAGSHSYTLALVTPSPYAGPALLGDTAACTSLGYQLLEVDVRDDKGQPVDGVEILWSPTSSPSGFVGPLGLGSSVSGWGIPGLVPAKPGRAVVAFEPYSKGVQFGTCSVLASEGSSNVLTFTVLGQ